MSKLVLIDGNAIMHRAFHAMPPFRTPQGDPIGAVHGFVSMLLKVIVDLKPTHVAIAFDRKEPTFRKKISKDYQAHRPEMDGELIPQFAKARAVAEVFDIPVYDKAGYEADDVIGTIASEAKTDEVVILTGDKDMLQLISGKTKLYMPVKGLSNAKLFGNEETIERLGVYPKQIVDFKALVGDPSDNYKGVPGIGPKTAANLLKTYGSLENVYKNLDKVSSKTRELLKKHKPLALQSQELARIVTGVDINFDLEKAKNWRIDSSQVFELFQEFGFKTLTKRAQKIGKEIVSRNQEQLF